MFFSDVEKLLYGLDDTNGVVIANPDDQAYELAVGYAVLTNRALRGWLYGSPNPLLSIDGKSIVLIFMWHFMLDETIDQLLSSITVNGIRQREIGLITGKTVDEIRSQLERSLRKNSFESPLGWILANGDMLSDLMCKTLKINANLHTASSIASQVPHWASYGVVAGHGREDICYFESFAICGQLVSGNGHRPCDPDNCPYQIPKISAELITARLLVLLSCSSGKLGHGLFPSTCRLALSSIIGGTTACLAARYLFTLCPDLVQYILDLLEANYTIGQVARLAGKWYCRKSNEPDPFIVLGEPDLKPFENQCPLQPNVISIPIELESSLQVGCFVDDKTEYKLSRIYTGLQTLKLTNLLPQSAVHLLDLLVSRQGSLIRLLTWASSKQAAKVSLKRVMAMIEDIAHDAEDDLLSDLTSKSLEGYFWLADMYKHYKLVTHRSALCHFCGSLSIEGLYRHPFIHSSERLRITCSRCGIVQDLVDEDACVKILSAEMLKDAGEHFCLVTVDIKSFADSGLLSLSINRGKQILGQVELLSLDDELCQKETLPIRLKAPAKIELKVGLSNLLHGVYYLHVFWIEHLQLYMASAPVSYLISSPNHS